MMTTLLMTDAAASLLCACVCVFVSRGSAGKGSALINMYLYEALRSFLGVHLVFGCVRVEIVGPECVCVCVCMFVDVSRY